MSSSRNLSLVGRSSPQMDAKRLYFGLLLFCFIGNEVRAQFCPNGGTVFTQPVNYMPLSCTPMPSYYSSDFGNTYYGTSSSRGCPLGYTCLASPASTYTSGSTYTSNQYSSQYFCCSASSTISGSSFSSGISLSPFCPPNSQLWTSNNGVSGNALTCSTPGAFCQNGYTCQQSPYNSGLYCCSTGSLFGTGINFCPQGSRPIYVGGGAQTCTPNYDYGASSCPIGYNCYVGSSGYNYGTNSYGTTGYCCSVQYGNSYGKRKRRQVSNGPFPLFGGKSAPNGYPSTEQTGDPYCPVAVVGVTCSMGGDVCSQFGSDFVCHFNSVNRLYRCCSLSAPNSQGRKKGPTKSRKIAAAQVPSAK